MSTRSLGWVHIFMAAVVAALVLGCSPTNGDARDLAVSSDKAARELVSQALVELANGDTDVVLKRFCDQSPKGIVDAQDLVTPAIRRSDVSVLRVEAAWVGPEPWFYVEVGAPSRSFVHGFGVRVRDGCLDRAVGATVLPRPPPKHVAP